MFVLTLESVENDFGTVTNASPDRVLVANFHTFQQAAQKALPVLEQFPELLSVTVKVADELLLTPAHSEKEFAPENSQLESAQDDGFDNARIYRGVGLGLRAKCYEVFPMGDMWPGEAVVRAHLGSSDQLYYGWTDVMLKL